MRFDILSVERIECYPRMACVEMDYFCTSQACAGNFFWNIRQNFRIELLKEGRVLLVTYIDMYLDVHFTFSVFYLFHETRAYYIALKSEFEKKTCAMLLHAFLCKLTSTQVML